MSFFGPTSAISNVLQSLSAISEKQRMTSANIANANTPGYLAQSVSFSDLLKADHPFETVLSEKMGSKLIEEGGTTGMPVDMQKELIEMQKNLLFYSMVTRRASTIFNGLKTAAGVGR
jgi:flagellar basal body rod protein FlgB